jgi:nitrous oxide reductase accessory protein NosL
MRRGLLAALFMAVLLSIAGLVLAQEDVKVAPSCKYCGMDRTKFARSRMLVTYDDDSRVGTCSIHCLAIDFVTNIDKTPMVIEVGDFFTGRLVDAEKAFWVIGGNKPAVMTHQAEWAFAKKVYADKFIREHGGTLATFDEAMKAAYESMYVETKMIREKRKMKKTHEVEQK